MTAADRLRFVVTGIAEGLIFSLLFCVLGVLTLQLASGPEVVEGPLGCAGDVAFRGRGRSGALCRPARET